MDLSGSSRGALPRAQLWFFSTALVITALDQVVKRVVVHAMQMGQSIDVVGSVVRLTRTSNTGGAFGLLRGRGNWFIAVSFVAAVAIAVLAKQLAKARRVERLAFSMILGGAAGNLIDRIRLGAVVDFIDIGGSGYRWPAFNVADSAITIGVTLLAISLVFLGGAADGREAEPDVGDGQ